ncbi:MAG TPA: hypothetical protein VIQ31_37345 [Phormidium sp.]
MSNSTNEQLNLFNQPTEVFVEVNCTVKRASQLIGCSKASIYKHLSQNNQPYRREVATGEWIVYSEGRKNRLILASVAFVFSPKDDFWRLA